MTVTDGPSWNPITDLQEMWSFPFMVNAFRAGTIVAVLAAVIGHFMVLRRQSFAGHTLSLVGFPGAAGAVLIGVAAAYGYFAFCLAGAAVIAMLPRTGRGGYSEESAVTGTVQASRWRAVSCSSPCTKGSSTASMRCCSAVSWASPRRRSPSWASSPRLRCRFWR